MKGQHRAVHKVEGVILNAEDGEGEGGGGGMGRQAGKQTTHRDNGVTEPHPGTRIRVCGPC